MLIVITEILLHKNEMFIKIDADIFLISELTASAVGFTRAHCCSCSVMYSALPPSSHATLPLIKPHADPLLYDLFV